MIRGKGGNREKVEQAGSIVQSSNYYNNTN